MTQREAKRPYGGSQSHITSYFPQQSQSQLHDQQQQTSNYSISHDLSHETSRAPSLPHSVQSNLLSVGMRVRKSVPEGYKTGNEYSAFNLFTASKSLPCTPTVETSPRSSGRPRANAGARELMPFCGLLKVGGMGSQQAWGIYSPTKEQSWSRYDCHGVEDMVPGEDDVPFLSQGSTDSSFSAAGTPKGHKRRCEWDDSGDDEDAPDANSSSEVQMGAPLVLGGRAIAVPRRRKSPSIGGGAGEAKVFGEDMDFGEAEFLDFNGFKGVEVEMGGL